MYGADPRFFPYGTKTGCRRLFAEQGVRHPLGREDLSTTAELADAIAELRAERPGMSQVIVKLNEGVSGEGNALLSLDGLSDGAGQAEIEERLRELQFELPEITYDGYTDMLEKRGGVVEERISRRGVPQPERPDARHAARQARGAVHARPAARRAERAELPRLHLPRRPWLRDARSRARR